MIDLHCHALGEEEVVTRLEGALEVCARAHHEGVEEMIVTTRLPRDLEAKRAHGRAFAARLNELRATVGEEIRLGGGYEWLLGPDLLEQLRSAPFAPTINEGHYLLVGFPALSLPEEIEATIKALVAEGYAPVLAHPECSRAVRRAGRLVGRLVKAGALVQIDALSLTGGYSPEVERFARALLEEEQAHFIATRSSVTARAGASLATAYERASRIVGRSAAAALVKENPRAALANEAMRARTPRRARMSSFKALLRASFNSGG
jgi:protein-tyrosine phosphatase